METINQGSCATAFTESLSTERLRSNAPAVFAESPDERTSASYKFISTERVLKGLEAAGLVPVEVRQSGTRKVAPIHARHMVRLRRRFETVQLTDSIPELVFINAHDGRSSYQLQVGIYRVVCTNGLIVADNTLPVMRMAHRGAGVDEVVAAALELTERFAQVAARIERMEQRQLNDAERNQFALEALAVRYPQPELSGLQPSRLLAPQRVEDVGNDLWRVMNTVQGHLLRGGLQRTSAQGRLTRMRGITAIRENVRMNRELWSLADRWLTAA